MEKMHIAFKRAIENAGGVRALASKVDRTTANLYSLIARDRPCPPALVIATERASGISRHVLRPDLYPVE